MQEGDGAGLRLEIIDAQYLNCLVDENSNYACQKNLPTRVILRDHFSSAY